MRSGWAPIRTWAVTLGMVAVLSGSLAFGVQALRQDAAGDLSIRPEGPRVSGLAPQESFPTATTQRLPNGRVITRPLHISELPASRPSIVFPAGTNYAEALGALHQVRLRAPDALPAGARLGAPLPEGIVMAVTTDGSLRLDSRAPFGYDPREGWLTEPSVLVDGPQDASETLAIPVLPDCVVLTADESVRPAACGTKPTPDLAALTGDPSLAPDASP